MAQRLGFDPGTFVDDSSAVSLNAAFANGVKSALNTDNFDADLLAGKAPSSALSPNSIPVTSAEGYIAKAQLKSSDITDKVAEGGIYNNVTVAVAAALNAGTYKAADATTADDADKVSAFGIGTDAKNMVNSLDDYVTNGFFRDPAGLINSPWGSSAEATVHVLRGDSDNYVYQIAYKIVTSPYPSIKFRAKYIANRWTPWYEVWTAFSDGNGGQPPAPKPRNANNNSIGEMVFILGADNTDVTAPNPGGAGASTWCVVERNFQNSSTGVLVGYSTLEPTHLYAGGATVLVASPGYRGRVRLIRIA